MSDGTGEIQYREEDAVAEASPHVLMRGKTDADVKAAEDILPPMIKKKPGDDPNSRAAAMAEEILVLMVKNNPADYNVIPYNGMGRLRYLPQYNGLPSHPHSGQFNKISPAPATAPEK